MAAIASFNATGAALGDTHRDFTIAKIYDAAAGRYLWQPSAADAVVGYDEVADAAALAAFDTSAIADGHSIKQLDTDQTFTWDADGGAWKETGTTLETIIVATLPDPVTVKAAVRYAIVENSTSPGTEPDGQYTRVTNSWVPSN